LNNLGRILCDFLLGSAAKADEGFYKETAGGGWPWNLVMHFVGSLAFLLPHQARIRCDRIVSPSLYMPRDAHALMQNANHLGCVLPNPVHDDMGTDKVETVRVRQFPALVPKLRQPDLYPDCLTSCLPKNSYKSM